MVFVTVGSTENDFARLLRAIDDLVEREVIRDVVAQIGSSSYIPHSYEFFAFRPFAEIDQLVRSADLVIAHAGTGTLNHCLGLRKKVIVVPRLKLYEEHPDDHQLELAELLRDDNRVLYARSTSDLAARVVQAEDWEPTFRSNNSFISLIEALDACVQSLLVPQRRQHRTAVSNACREEKT